MLTLRAKSDPLRMIEIVSAPGRSVNIDFWVAGGGQRIAGTRGRAPPGAQLPQGVVELRRLKDTTALKGGGIQIWQ